jgi:hydroxypyruvate reductase
VQVPGVHADANERSGILSQPATHIGGRNQHFALYLATRLRSDDGVIAVLSAGSDGIDGNSDAAGAIVDGHTLDGDDPVHSEANSESTSRLTRRDGAKRALAAFDSSTWLHGSEATIVTGPTGHNLRDLRILLAL